MNIIQTLRMDFSVRGVPQTIYAKQDDSGSLRGVAVSIYNSGVPIEIDDDAAFMLRYKTAQGAIGLYDTLPDGSSAFGFQPNTSSNTVTVTLVDQIFASPGVVECELRIMASNGSVSTWSWFVNVAKSNVGDATIPSDYINVIAGYAASAAKSATEAKAAVAAVPNLVEFDLTAFPVSSDFNVSLRLGKVAYWGAWCFLSYGIEISRKDSAGLTSATFNLVVPGSPDYGSLSPDELCGVAAGASGAFRISAAGPTSNGFYITATNIAGLTSQTIDFLFSTQVHMITKT